MLSSLVTHHLILSKNSSSGVFWKHRRPLYPTVSTDLLLGVSERIDLPGHSRNATRSEMVVQSPEKHPPTQSVSTQMADDHANPAFESPLPSPLPPHKPHQSALLSSAHTATRHSALQHARATNRPPTTALNGPDTPRQRVVPSNAVHPPTQEFMFTSETNDQFPAVGQPGSGLPGLNW